MLSPGRAPWLKPALLVSALVAVSLAAVWVVRHDLTLSDAARAIPGAHEDFSFWWLVNFYGEVPTWTVVGLAALACLGSRLVRPLKAALGRFRPHLLFLLGTAVLGPGLLNQGLKALFNRPRPDDVLGFLPAFVIGPAGHDRGFPSGHTATAFVLLALAFLVPRAKPLLRTLAGAVFVLWGCAVGLARVVYGAHYPSDVLFGAILTVAVEVVLWRAVFRRRTGSAELT